MEHPSLNLIFKYALGFNGYQAFGGFENLAHIANERQLLYRETGTWEGTARELRACLFFEERRWTHFGWKPEGDDLAVTEALFDAIQRRIKSGDPAPNDGPEANVWGSPPVVVDGSPARLLEWSDEDGLVLKIAWDESGEVGERRCPPSLITPDNPSLRTSVDWLFNPAP